MPSPRQWPDAESLVRDLRRCDWQGWFERNRKLLNQSDLELVIKKSVGKSTFRQFVHMPYKPSESFHSWAREALERREFFDSLLRVKDHQTYDRWLNTLTHDLCRDWKRRMGRIMPYGPGIKLADLLAKGLCCFREVPKPKAERLLWLLHVPLDKYTILAIRNCLNGHLAARDIGKIPSNAAMGFVKNERMYKAFQTVIRDFSREASVPAIALDILSWEVSTSKHQSPPTEQQALS